MYVSKKMLVVLACTCVAALFLVGPGPAASKDSKVKVGLYSEALCSGCLNFINYPLTDAFNEVS